MWLPDNEIEAIPSQPVFPYALLQMFTLPDIAGQFADPAPGVIVVVSTPLPDQSVEVVLRYDFQAGEVVRLSTSCNVKMSAVRAQWYLPHECLALAMEVEEARKKITTTPVITLPLRKDTFFTLIIGKVYKTKTICPYLSQQKRGFT